MSSGRWKGRIKRRRGKAFHPGHIRELNLVAMMDMLTVLVVFLLKSYSASALSIPVGESISFPETKSEIAAEEAVKLTVTKIGQEDHGVIAVDDEKVLLLTPDMLKTLEGNAKKRNFMIKTLHDALTKRADAIKAIAKINEQQKFEGKILVIADKDTPYWLITQALFTAAAAEFDQYNLVGLRASAE